MSDEVTEVDSVKLLSDGGMVRTPKSGDKPRSIRKKGFWRAYRRGELWALVSYQTKELMRSFAEDLFKPNPFAKIVADPNVPEKYIYITYPMVGLSDIIKDEK